MTRHQAPLVAAGLLALLALWFWPLLIGDQLGQSYALWYEAPWAALKPAGVPAVHSGEGDAAVVFHPLLEAARAQLHAGRFPVWNPWSYAGMPLHGDIQTALLYPLTWLALVLPVATAWGPMAVGKLLIAGIGTWLLGRELGLGRGPAVVAALVFMLSAPNLAWLQWPLTTVFALLPWLLWATERLWREPSRRRLAGLGLIVGLAILAGHPETALLGSCAAGVYLLVRGRGSGIGRWAAGHALGAMLAAAALLPFLEAYRVSITRAEHGDFAKLSMPAEAALLWALPNVFGDGTPDYVGPLRTYVTTAGFFGVAALLLALVALVRLRREPVAQGLAAMAAVALAVVFAIPPVSWITRNVPPFATGNNLRVLHVVALAGALGAGAGVQLLARRALPLRSVAGWVLGAGAVVGLALAGAAAAGKLPAPRSTEVAAVVRFAGSLVAAAACLVALGRHRWAGVLVGVVVVAELAYLRGFNVMLAPEKAYPPRPPAVAAMQARIGDGRVSVLRPGPFEPLFQPDTSALYELEAIQGYDYPQPKRWADFSWFVLHERGPSREIILSSPPTRGASLTGLRLMNTRLYIGPPAAAVPHPDMRTVYRGRDGSVFEDPQALPRAYVLGRVRRLEDSQALALLRRGGLDPRAEAIVPPGVPQPPPAPANFRPASARRLSEEHWRIDVPRGGGGWLVVANAFGPQWRATVDGREARLYPTDFAATGLSLPAGARRVELTVSHRSLHWGLALSALACVLLAGLAWRRG
jgi:6-pyruvoyl-tetrahydropterin synthase related domain